MSLPIGELDCHDMDFVTDYCLKCGIDMRTVIERLDYKCLATPNVIAISHIICNRKFEAFMRKGQQ